MKIRMKIRSKLLLSVMAIVIVTYGLCIGYLIFKLRDISLQEAFEKADLYAKDNANIVGAMLNKDMDISRTMVHGMHDFRKIPQKQRASTFVKMLHGVTVGNPNLLSVWGNWEINAMDSTYKKPYGRNRYIFFREEGEIKYTEETLNLDGEAYGTSYYGVKQSKQETMLDPYWFTYSESGEQILEASTAVPLLENGNFVGLFGVDIPLVFYQDFTSKIKPFEGSFSIIFSHNGTIVGHQDEKYLGKVLGDVYPVENGIHGIAEKIFNGVNFSFVYTDTINSNEYYATFIAISIGQSQTPWSFALFTPTKVLLQQQKQISKKAIILSLIGFSVLSLVILFIAYGITKPLAKIKNLLSELSLGKINVEKSTEIRTGDEMEDINHSLNTLIDALSKTIHFASEIGKGNLNIQHTKLSEDDVLGMALLDMQASLVKAKENEDARKKEAEQTNWSTLGIAKFAEILRLNNDNIAEFSYQVISNLVKYIGAQIGALFLFNDDNSEDLHFELAASYAYDRRKYIEKRIEIGEGLVGRCAQEGEVIFMTDIPKDYIQIVSGLGDENPRCLLLVPLKLNEEVYGVVELASFEIFESHVVEFVKRIGESIAATISTVKINIKTAQLLAESKHKSEELASQEEEMRQNMEELQATQEESARKTAEMESLINAIHSSNYVIEYDTKGKIINANEAYLNLMNITLDVLVGTHHSDNLVMTEKQLIEYKSFWEDLSRGAKKKETSQLSIHDKIYTFMETYAPIFNEKNEVIKILKIAQNITDFTESNRSENGHKRRDNDT